MNIRIFWGTGYMVVDADVLLEELTLASFKKWCKLFCRFGNEADYPAVASFCAEKIEAQKKNVEVFDGEISELQGKLDGTIPTVLAKKYLREQIRLKQRHRSGAAQKLTRLEKKYACLIDALGI